MLMDNSGVAKIEGAGGEPVPSTAEAEKFDAFLAERGDLKTPELGEPLLGKGEKVSGAEQAEMVNQAMTNVAPARSVSTDDDMTRAMSDSPELRELSQIAVPRDAEQLPKPYMDKVVTIIHKDRKDPHQLVTDLDLARWDMMRKAFNRKRGDGK